LPKRKNGGSDKKNRWRKTWGVKGTLLAVEKDIHIIDGKRGADKKSTSLSEKHGVKEKEGERNKGQAGGGRIKKSQGGYRDLGRAEEKGAGKKNKMAQITYDPGSLREERKGVENREGVSEKR